MLNFGIIGAGNHSLLNLVPAFKNLANSNLLQIGTTKQNLSSSSLLNIKISNYEELLMSQVIDVVIISLPNSLHDSWTKKSLESGKHVLVEKPISYNLINLTTNIAIANQEKLLLKEAFMYRLHPIHKRVKELLAENQIGVIKSFSSNYSYQLPINTDNIRRKKNLGGGILLDALCYPLDSLFFLFNAKIQDFSHTYKTCSVDNIDTEQHLYGRAEIKKNQVIDFSLFSSMESKRENFYLIRGTLGEIFVKNAFHISPNQKTKIVLKNDKGTSTFEFEPTNCFALEIESFTNEILGKEISVLGRGLKNAEMLEKIYSKCYENN